MLFGRGDLEEAYDIPSIVAANAKDRRDTDCFAEKLGNDYFLWEAKRFCVTVAPAGHGV